MREELKRHYAGKDVEEEESSNMWLEKKNGRQFDLITILIHNTFGFFKY